MIAIKLKGGLGNQMFQYTFAKATAQRLGCTFQMDCTWLLDRARGEKTYRDYDLDIFKIKPDFTISPKTLRSLYQVKFGKVGKFIRRYFSGPRHIYVEPHFHFDKHVATNPQENTSYDGWWQSPKYFVGLESEIRRDFSFAKKMLSLSNKLYEKIQTTDAICLNVRRTDFIGNATLETTDLNYFSSAISHIQSQVAQPHFFIFSDDMEWCHKHLKPDAEYTYVDHEHKGYKFGNYLQLMSACKHFIIPNSTFAWWAAYLSDRKDKIVIAPARWFGDAQINTSDLIPGDWIRM